MEWKRKSCVTAGKTWLVISFLSFARSSIGRFPKEKTFNDPANISLMDRQGWVCELVFLFHYFSKLIFQNKDKTENEFKEKVVLKKSSYP